MNIKDKDGVLWELTADGTKKPIQSDETYSEFVSGYDALFKSILTSKFTQALSDLDKQYGGTFVRWKYNEFINAPSTTESVEKVTFDVAGKTFVLPVLK